MFGIFGNKRPRPGYVWEGPACYTDDYTAVQRPGFYALTEDGKNLIQPPLRLVYIDDAPGDPTDGSGHYEVASATDPVQKWNTGQPIVELKIEVVGQTEVAP